MSARRGMAIGLVLILAMTGSALAWLQLHDPTLAHGIQSVPACQVCALDHGAGHGPSGCIEYPREGLRTRREQETQRPWEQHNPLTNWCAREHMIDHVRGGLHHVSVHCMTDRIRGICN